MNSQDHEVTVTSAGHGVHLCHRCGWPFPNPHPSSRHRRAHKKLCGTIEGYTIILSEEHDPHLSVSDDEHGSDENEHTPSPIPVKKSAEVGSISGGVGGKSFKLEDDVFSDAVTDFSDSGTSPRLEEQFASVRGVDKNVEERSVESDLYANESMEVDETAVGVEKFNDSTKSDEVSNHVLPIPDTSAGAASVALLNGAQLDHKSEVLRDVVVSNVNECDVEEDKLAPVSLDTEEGKISDPALTETEKTEELCDKLVSESVKHDLPSEMDASTEMKSVAHSSEISGEVNTQANVDASVGVKKVSFATEDMPPVKPSDTIPIEKKVSLDGSENSVNSDTKENQNVESKDDFYVQTVLTPVSVENTFAPKDDESTMFVKKDEDHCEESSNGTLLEIRNEKGEGVTNEEVQATPDSKVPEDNSIDFPRSCDSTSLEELSKNESRDNGVEKSIEGLGTCKVTEVVDSGLNHDAEVVVDKSSPPTEALEDPVSPVNSETTSEPPVSKDSISVGTDSESLSKDSSCESSKAESDATKVSSEQNSVQESLPIPSETSPKSVAIVPSAEPIGNDEVSSEQNSECPALTVQESLPIQTIPSEISPAVEERYLVEDSGTPKSAAIVPSAEPIGNNEVSSEQNSECPALTVQESLPIQTIPSETSLAVEDSSTPMTVVIVPSAEPIGNDNVLTSDRCMKDAQGLPGTVAAAVDDKNLSNIEVVPSVDSKSSQDHVPKQNDDISATDLSGSPCSISDSLEGNVGSASALSSQSYSAIAEINSQSPDKLETTTKEANPSKSDDFEPPSFMTLVQPGGKDDQATADSEIRTVQNNQQPKADALKAGWFPSIANVVNESEGRKKNEEMIAKVTNWSPGKQHGPLKNLLSEVKSPNEKQVPAAANPKQETECKDNGDAATTVNSILGPDAPPAPNKDVEEWNSPARYPIEVKKEKKKKGRSYWVPFVCCSSVHRDL